MGLNSYFPTVNRTVSLLFAAELVHSPGSQQLSISALRTSARPVETAMKDWEAAQKRTMSSLGTWKKAAPNQRCLAQLWEKFDNGVKVGESDLRHCSECVLTLKWLRRRGIVYPARDGTLRRVAR